MLICLDPETQHQVFFHNREPVTQKRNHPLEQHKPFLTLLCNPYLIAACLCYIGILKTSSSFKLDQQQDILYLSTQTKVPICM